MLKGPLVLRAQRVLRELKVLQVHKGQEVPKERQMGLHKVL